GSVPPPAPSSKKPSHVVGKPPPVPSSKPGPPTGKQGATPGAKAPGQKQDRPTDAAPTPTAASGSPRAPAARRGPVIQTAGRADGSITADVTEVAGSVPKQYAVTVRV